MQINLFIKVKYNAQNNECVNDTVAQLDFDFIMKVNLS